MSLLNYPFDGMPNISSPTRGIIITYGMIIPAKEEKREEEKIDA